MHKQNNHVGDLTISFRIPDALLRKLDHYCESHDITRSQILRARVAGFEPLQKIENPAPFSYPQWSSKS
jgi:predicted transcriptional regulator